MYILCSSMNDHSRILAGTSDSQPPVLSASEKSFWSGRSGIGFSVDSLGRWDDQARLESALQEITRLGFDTIRTWDTNAYTGRILEAISDLGLNLKVQAGIYLRKDSDAEQKIVSALQTINSHPDLVIGVSLGNEQLADWNNTGLTVADVIQHVNFFREFSDIPLTYNFSGETLRGNSSFWAQNGEELLRKLDYINVHSYAGFFDNRWNPEWTPGRQLEVLKLDEALFRKTLDNFGLHSTPLILGETGWQSVGGAQSVTNAENMETYFQSTRDYIQGDLARFDAMFYFNLSDESWKGGDNHWGLFEEGGSDSLGAAKFDIELDVVPESQLLLVADSGSARLLVDDTTGLAFIQQNASDQPLLIRRNDSYWQGDIPLQRGDAALVSAAVDADGQLRVLDRGPWGDFSWILDPSGLFIGEDAPGVLSVPETEALFQIDLDADGIIPAPPSPESDAQDELNSNTVSAFEATGFNQGEFVSTIAFSHRATVDPIVAPGNTKFMHAHDFFANPTTGASSTVASLMDASDTAAIPINNISTYWTPSLIDEGSDGVGGEQTYVTPKATSIAYYSVLKPNEPSELVNMPIGLKMIAGSARPQNRQSRAQVFWNYIGELASYDHIPLGDEWRDLPLQAVIIFPEYWTGQSLDSPDHKSHVAYGDGSGVGPNEHPLLIPQLQLQIHYGRINNNLHLVSSDYMSLPEAGGDLDLRLQRGNPDDLSFRNGESGFAPGWSMHADQIHLPWEEVAPNGETVDGFARRETDALMLPLFAGTDGNSVRIIPTGIQQPYSAERSPMPMLGSPGNDVLTGSSSDDRLESLEGDDILIGGGGADRLVGGDGADRFVIESINESTVLRPDVLVGFAPEDRLDLRGLNLQRDDLILQSTGPSSWFLTASDTDLGILIRTDSITFEQIMIDGGHPS